jgi:Na+/H+ antiporter NhaD/arsenite permease-like protein
MTRTNLDKYITLSIILLAVITLSQYLGFSIQQSISVGIITLFITSTFLFWNNRLSYGFIGVSLLLTFGVLDIEHLIKFANLNIIIFLIGMMIIVGYLERNHFFEYIIGKLIEKVGKSGKLLIIVILVIAALSAALIDEVTSILIMTAIVIHFASEYKVNPIPFVLMTVFATNIGSSATVVGNPVGVLIALKGGLTFSDFLRWATPISIIALVVAILLLMFLFRKQIAEFDRNLKENFHKKEKELVEKHNLLAPALLFIGTLLALILHSNIEHLLGLEKNTMLIGIALIGAGIAMLLSKDEAQELVEQRVDWWTLMFFMFLFASVGSLEFTGVIDIFSSQISALTGGNIIFTLIVVMGVAGILSAVLDNVLAVAVMVPIIEDLIAASPGTSSPLWWALLFAATLFGNLTFIGSTANIVALGVLKKRKWGHISFMQWIKPGFVITAATAVIAFVLIMIQLPLMQ